MSELIEVEKEQKEKRPKPKFGMWSCLGFMLKLAAKHEPMLLWGGFIVMATGVIKNIANLFLSPMVLQAVEQKVPLGQLVGTIAFFIGILVIAECLGNYIRNLLLYSKITLRGVVVALINNKCATTSYCNVEDETFIKAKNIAVNSTNCNEAATEAIWGNLYELVGTIVGFVIYVLLLTNVEPMLLLVILLTTIPGYFINKYINGWEYRHREEKEEISRRINCITNNAGSTQAAKDIRIFGMRSWFDDMYRTGMRVYEAFHLRAAKVYIWSNILDLVLTFLRNGIAYFYLIDMVLEGGMSAAEFLLYFSTVGGFSGWVLGLLTGFSDLYYKCLDISSVRECLTFAEAYQFEEGLPVPCEENQPAEIRLEKVSFRYPGAEEETLKNINLTLHPRERLAVVGLNGAGKTTLVKLISGLYDPTEGRVTWNGVDVRTLNRREYYTMFSAIFQELTVIPGSLAVNVAVSETDIDMEKVRHCVEMADLTKKFEALPKGYETTLNKQIYEDAVELSGGECQRLILARALYKNAPVLLLDEPTAALDPIAESEIYQKYNEMTAGKSAVYISHRLASTRFCDRIVLIENNTIAEEGTHLELLAKKGRYAELFEVQSQYYREDYQPEGKEA